MNYQKGPRCFSLLIVLFLCSGYFDVASALGKPGDAKEVFLNFLEREIRNGDTSANVHEEAPLRVSIYYEALCPYSISFVRNQVVPVWKALGSQYIKLQFVPYGNAHTFFKSGLIITGCQHGEKECFGNKIHGCALQYLPLDTANDFILCSMSSDDPVEAARNCSEAVIPTKYNYTEVVLPCATGFTGELVLAVQGLMSLDFVTEGVPAVALNGELVEDDGVLENLILYVCAQIYQLSFQSHGFVLPNTCAKSFEAQVNSALQPDENKTIGHAG